MRLILEIHIYYVSTNSLPPSEEGGGPQLDCGGGRELKILKIRKRVGGENMALEKTVLDSSSISDLMKQSTGETLHKYLLRYRLRVARNLLVTSDIDVATVAWKCGFGSAAYFIKMFRADTGLTPAKYRKKNMENF